MNHYFCFILELCPLYLRTHVTPCPVDLLACLTRREATRVSLTRLNAKDTPPKFLNLTQPPKHLTNKLNVVRTYRKKDRTTFNFYFVRRRLVQEHND